MTIYALVKLVDKKEYAEYFRSGILRMRTLRYFTKYTDENGELRGDQYEGIAAWYQPDKVRISINNHVIPPSEIAAPIAIRKDYILNRHAFCLYSINSSGFEYITDETLSEFKRTLEIHREVFGLGRYCVAVLNVQKFFNRVRSAKERENFSLFERGPVIYFEEESFHGKFDDRLGFYKRSRFRKQREYRIIVNKGSNSGDLLELNIGNLSDISILTTPEEFNKDLEIKLPK